MVLEAFPVFIMGGRKPHIKKKKKIWYYRFSALFNISALPL